MMTTPSSASTSHRASTMPTVQPTTRPVKTEIDNSSASQKTDPNLFTLTRTAYEHSAKFLVTKRQLGTVEWSLNHLLHKLCNYFSRTFRGTELELTTGTFFALGREYWKTSLAEKFLTESLENSEGWNFCDQPPSFFEICFCLPARKVFKEDFERFIELCFYFIAIEALPDQLSDIECIREFGRIINPEADEPVTDTQAKRMMTIAKIMREIKGFARKIEGQDTTYQIPFFNQSSLQMTFSFSPPKKTEPFSLHLSVIDGALAYRINCKGQPLQALAEIAGQQLNAERKDRLLAFKFNHPTLFSYDLALNEKDVQALTPLGQFLYRYVFSPGSNVKEATAILTIIGFLQGCLTPAAAKAPCRQQDHLEIVWKCGSSTFFLRVPAHPENSLSVVSEGLKQNKKSCLSSLVAAFNIFFPPSRFILSRPAAPQVLQQSLEIYEALRADGSSVSLVWFLASCAAGWKTIEAEDLLTLPDGLCNLDRAPLNEALANLALVYQGTSFGPLFDRIKTRLEGLEDLSATAVRLVCLRELILSQEAKILPAAWKMWSEFCATLSPNRSFTLMLEICSRLNQNTIPFAVATVCSLCDPKKNALQPTERMQLLVVYLDRLLAYSSEEAVVTGYAPALVKELEALLQADPSLKSRVNSCPRVRNYLYPAGDETVPVNEPPKASDETWEHLQRCQENNDRRHFDNTVQRLTQALSSKETDLQNRKGFFHVLKWVVQVLFENKNYRAILSLLKHVTIKKSDTLYPKWFQTCLEELMKEKTAVETFTTYVAQFRESKVYSYVPPEFLLKLFEYLVRSAHLEDKIKRDEVRKEIKFLHDLVRPEGKAAFSFAECLVLYYPTLLEERLALQLVEDVIRNLQHMKDQQKTIITPLFNLAMKLPKDPHIWDKFSQLMEKLKSDAEYVLTLYEALIAEPFLANASITDPSFKMIRKGIAHFEKKLSDPQKVRLAKVLAALAALAQKEKKEGELLGSFASIEAFLSLIQKPETWQAFAQMFLDCVGKRKIDHRTCASFCSSMLWMAPRILSEEGVSMVGSFRTALLDIPLKDLQPEAAQWTRVIAGVVSRTTVEPSSLQLIKTMIELSSNTEEKRFFERCRGLYEARDFANMQSTMKAYHATGTFSYPYVPAALPTTVEPTPQEIAVPDYRSTGVPAAPPTTVEPPPQEKTVPDYRSYVEKILSGSPSSKELDNALIALRKCPGEEFGLWEKFFTFLTHLSPDLCARAWKGWMEKHPPEKARSEDGKYWRDAVYSCLTLQPDIKTFDDLLFTHLTNLLDRFPSDHYLPICQICFEIGINSCWETMPIKSSPKIKALFSLTNSAGFKTKAGELHEIITHESRVRFYLMLARNTAPQIQEVGHISFLSMVMAYGIPNNPVFDPNMILLRNFCTCPYLSEDEKTQKIIYEWIEFSWMGLRSTLSWEQALSLIEVLSQFNFPEYEVENIFIKWKEIISGSRQVRPEPNLFQRMVAPVYSSVLVVEQIAAAQPVKPLSIATRKMMQALLGSEKDPQRKTHYLQEVSLSLKTFRQQSHHQNSRELLSLLLYLTALSFENISKMSACREVIQIGLNNILLYLPSLEELWTTDCIDSTEAFVSALPHIMAFCAHSPDLMDLALQIIDLYMGVVRIRNAPPEITHSWTQLLISLCTSVEVIKLPLRKKIAQAAVKVFARCTSLSLLEKNRKIPASDQKHLMGISSFILGLNFLSLGELKCLDPSDWKELFQGFSASHLCEMLTDLASDLHEKPILHISIARIICHASSLKREILSPYLLSLSSKLSKLGCDALSLRIRTHYIHASIALTQRDPSKQNTALKKRLIQDFVPAFFTGINDENHVKFKKIFLQLLEDIEDSDVIEKIKKAYVIPFNVPLSLRENLLAIKVVDIEKRLQSLHSR